MRDLMLPTEVPPGRIRGRVARVVGGELEVRGLRLAVGDAVQVHTNAGPRPAEVVALADRGVRTLLYGDTTGIARGDEVTISSDRARVAVSKDMVGRVLDGLGRPIDGGRPIIGELVDLDNPAPTPLSRRRIDEPLPTGVRVIDSLCTVGRGQRMGIFAGSGTGKSTLLGMCARGTAADINVVALIGERGREVREFLEDDLGPEGAARTITIVATSDEPPLVRLRAAILATRIAEWFADGGSDVLLMMDSVTRLAMAQREIGLAAGEPPTARGYTPSVFALLPKLLERAGTRPNGSITAIYTVLTEGSSLDDDPIADTTRSILDGHIILDRGLLHLGRVPPIDALGSLSRLSGKVLPAQASTDAATIRGLLAAAEEVRDLVEVGAYVAGTNPRADRALAMQDELHAFLRQDREEVADWDETWNRVALLAAAGRGTNDPNGGAP